MIDDVVSPVLQRKVNGPIPPVTFAVSVAEPGVQIVADEELILTAADCVTVIVD